MDLSHCGRQTAADAIKASKKPVAFTHTGSAALNDHPRNRTDAELRAVAEKGGVSGVYFMPFLSEGKQPTAADVIRHLEHMIDVAGEDHVSLGTDGGVSAEVVTDEFKKKFAGSCGSGVTQASRRRARTRRAISSPTSSTRRAASRPWRTCSSARGHGDARIEKILGKNLVRVFSDTWKPEARRGRSPSRKTAKVSVPLR